MTIPIFWIDHIHIGTKHLILLLCVSTIAILVAQIYNPSGHLSLFLGSSLITITGLLSYAAYSYGICIRRFIFREHGQLFEIRDYYKPLRSSENYRVLTRLNQNTVDSKIYLSQEKRWAYFDSIRIVLDSHRLPTYGYVLVLGGGGGSIAKTIHQTYPNLHIDVVEISTSMISVAKQYFLTPDDLEKIQLIHDDALRYVTSIDKKYIIIFVDLFVNSNIPTSVLSKKFIRNLSRIHSPNGIIFINFGHCPEINLPRIIPLYKKMFPNFRLHLLNKNLIGLVAKNNTNLDITIS